MSNPELDIEIDTIALFSVFHHISKMGKAAEYIRSNCKRIIMECKLQEHGSVPVAGSWKATNEWEFSTAEDLIEYIEKLLPPFKLDKKWGQCDRDRYILTFVRDGEC
jgi:hypothetical protein